MTDRDQCEDANAVDLSSTLCPHSHKNGYPHNRNAKHKTALRDQDWSAAIPCSLSAGTNPGDCSTSSAESVADAIDVRPWAQQKVAPCLETLPPKIIPSASNLPEGSDGVGNNACGKSSTGGVEVDAKTKWQLRQERKKARSSGRKHLTYGDLLRNSFPNRPVSLPEPDRVVLPPLPTLNIEKDTPRLVKYGEKLEVIPWVSERTSSKTSSVQRAYSKHAANVIEDCPCPFQLSQASAGNSVSCEAAADRCTNPTQVAHLRPSVANKWTKKSPMFGSLLKSLRWEQRSVTTRKTNCGNQLQPRLCQKAVGWNLVRSSSLTGWKTSIRKMKTWPLHSGQHVDQDTTF